MITQERYGIRADGNPVMEVTSYQEAAPDHPAAVQLDGIDGHWVKTMIGNSLTALGAREVSYQEFLDAGEDIRLRGEAVMEELERQRDIREREQEDRKAQAMAELVNLGISAETIDVILAKVRG